jgi:hypothetical protein
LPYTFVWKRTSACALGNSAVKTSRDNWISTIATKSVDTALCSRYVPWQEQARSRQHHHSVVVDGALAKAGFNPDEPREEGGRWTNDGAGALERILQMLGSELSDGAKALLSEIGRTQINQSNADLAAATPAAHAIADGLKAYETYRAKPWIGRDGKPFQVPVINIGDPISELAALLGHEPFTPNAPLTRPATNAEWIDPLVNLVSVGAMAAGPAVRLAGPAIEALDTGELSANAAADVSTFDQLSAAASRAADEVGQGSGPLYGTAMHSAFRVEVNALGNADLSTEQSYLYGQVVSYGTPQSVRLDVIEERLDTPTAGVRQERAAKEICEVTQPYHDRASRFGKAGGRKLVSPYPNSEPSIGRMLACLFSTCLD